jgi:hypothetical protein
MSANYQKSDDSYTWRGNEQTGSCAAQQRNRDLIHSHTNDETQNNKEKHSGYSSRAKN